MSSQQNNMQLIYFTVTHSTALLPVNQEDKLLLNSLPHQLIQHQLCLVPVGINDFGILLKQSFRGRRRITSGPASMMWLRSTGRSL